MRQSLVLGILTCLLFSGMAHAQEDPIVLPVESYVRATVLEVKELQEGHREMRLRIEDGDDRGREVITNEFALARRQEREVGQRLVIQRLAYADGHAEYIVRDIYRLPSLAWLAVAFFVLGVLLGGRIGATSLLGLVVSIGIIVLFIVPRIVAGDDPLVISIIGSAGIACTSLYLAHGFHRRTTIALISTVATLVLSMAMAVLFVHLSELFGTGSEESLYLLTGPLEKVDLRGLLLGGIIIGALGVLDDITTAQTAAVQEISRANPSLTFRELYRSGTSIGREHIASLINTLALAYVGASLPLLLLFSLDTDTPLWVTINSEFLAEEIIRTLVGSATLIVAVPIATWCAAWAFQGGHSGPSGSQHPCALHHH